MCGRTATDKALAWQIQGAVLCDGHDQGLLFQLHIRPHSHTADQHGCGYLKTTSIVAHSRSCSVCRRDAEEAEEWAGVGGGGHTRNVLLEPLSALCKRPS